MVRGYRSEIRAGDDVWLDHPILPYWTGRVREVTDHVAVCGTGRDSDPGFNPVVTWPLALLVRHVTVTADIGV